MVKILLSVSLIFISSILSLAQQTINNLFIKQPTSIVKNTIAVNNLSTVNSAQILLLNVQSLSQLRSIEDNYNLTIPTKNGDLILELTPSNITSADFKVMTPNGPVNIVLPTFYKGKIKGESKSYVSLTVTNESLEGLISSNKVNLTIGKLISEKENFHVVYNTNDIKDDRQICSGEVPIKETITSNLPNNQTSATTCRAVEIYLEADNKMFTDWGSVDLVTSRMTTIFNNVATLYDNQGINLVISTLFIWTTPDPYESSTNSSTALNLLDTYWDNRGNDFNGDIVHLVSTKSLGGGVAYLLGGTSVYNGMTQRAVFASCGKGSAKGLSGNINTSTASLPTYSWNVNVIAHELGHNFGLPHTQSCTWSDGTNIGALDDCYTVEGTCSPGPTPSNGGTIMSYCHTKSGVGINLANGFGSLPGAKMLAEFNAATCLTGSKIAKPTLSISSKTICSPQSVNLQASGCAGTYNWYDVATGGSSLSSNSSYNTPTINSNKNYYVNCTVNSCTSKREMASIIYFTNTPPTTTAVTNCGLKTTVTLVASGCSGLTYNWYKLPTGGDIIASGSSIILNNVASDSTFYVSCTAVGCGTTSRTSLFVDYTGLCQLCVPSSTNALNCSLGDDITEVALSRNGAIIFTKTNACTSLGYSSSSFNPLIFLVRDSVYTITVKNKGTEKIGLKVWFDYNQNNEFETSEEIYSFYNGATWPSKTFDFTVPSNAKIGLNRLRIVTNWLQMPVDACNITNKAEYGEIEDYVLNIKCKENINIENPSLASGIIKVSEVITSNVNLQSGFTFSAGKSILLAPGFQVGISETFTAQIGSCN